MLFSVLFLLLRTHVSGANEKHVPQIRIGAVMPANPDMPFSIPRLAGAAAFAIEELNETDMSHSFSLSISYRDSQCNEAMGMNEAINFKFLT